MALDLKKHPCFDDSQRHTFGRLHLPVAPKCNIQCAFCNRQYDCVNESRPGVSSVVLSPAQASQYATKMIHRDPRLTVVGIAGPGDPFANSPQTMETLRLVRQVHPEILLCVATNGLELLPHARELADLNVSHVSITVNALEPAVAAPIYSWVRFENKVYRGLAGAHLLIARQFEAIKALKALGVVVKVNTIIVPSVNDTHVAELSAELARLGVDIQNCIALHPVAGTPMESTGAPSAELMESVQAQAIKYLPQMRHCARCRADAAGLIGESLPEGALALLRNAAAEPLRPDENRPYVAVATQEGVLVNQHLGQAEELWVFGRHERNYKLIEKRPAPEAGGGSYRWAKLAATFSDCRALLTCAAGSTPQMVLEHHGLKVVVMEGLIDRALHDIYSGLGVRSPARAQGCGSGCISTCSGDGGGCD